MSSSGQGSNDDDAVGVNRRDILKLSSLAALAGTSVELQGCNPRHDKSEPLPTDRLRMARAEDLALVEIGLVGMTRSSDDATLSWSDSNAARLFLYFQPQHILEGAYWDPFDEEQSLPADTPVPTRISGNSQLVFRPDTASGSIPFTFEAVLAALRSWIPVVDARALPPEDVTEPAPLSLTLPAVASLGERFSRLRQRRNAATAPSYQRFGQPFLTFVPLIPPPPPWARPGEDVTKVELPFRLILSPSRFGRFLHPTGPVASPDGVVGLWASRLAAVGPQEQPAADRFTSHRTVRAIWARDLDPAMGTPAGTPTLPDPSRLATAPFDSFANAEPAMLSIDRVDVALQSSHHDLREPGNTNARKTANPMRVDRLWLSALGGGLDVRGEWTESWVPERSSNNDINLVKWVNKTTLGRDHYVEVQRQGYLWPTGNRAVYVTVTEREVENGKALLHKRAFIVVGEVTRAFAPTTTGDDAIWRRASFRSVTFLDAVIECDPITNAADVPMEALVERGMVPATARVLLEDRLGKSHETSIQVAFFTSGADIAANRIGSLNALMPTYDLPMRNQRVAYADEGDPAGVMFETRTLRWEGHIIDNQVFPLLVEASLQIDAVRSLLRNSDAGSQATRMALHPAYLDHALGSGNENQVLFGVLNGETRPSLDFGSDSRRSGGFVAPNFDIGGISVLNGPIGGSADIFATQGFDAASYFDGALPKLFGVLSLSDLLSNVGAPTILSSAAESLESLLADVDRIGRLADTTLPAGPSQALQGTLDAVVTRVDNALTEATNGNLAALETELEALEGELTSLQSQMAGLGSGVTDPALKSLQPLIVSLLDALGTVSSIISTAMALQNALESRKVTLSWEADLDPISGLFDPRAPLVLEVSVDTATGGVDMTARLDDFSLELFGIISVPVDRFSFLQRSGSKPDIDVKLGLIDFLGMLKFVQTLIELVPLDGFSDPPSIDVDETGLTASISLPLPNLAVGVFSIENMNLAASLQIPFIGEAVIFRFAFCTRDNPFVLTVMCVGGGGFVGVEATPNGLRLVEVALEARASLSIDFGVASGSVSVSVGIYMNLHMPEPDSPAMTLQGYIRIRGEVQVLGLISACIMLSLTLTYQSQGNKLIGEAKMTVEVSVLFFSASVTIRVRRQLSGDNQDPTVLETMAPQDPSDPMLGANSTTAPWALYVNAFAA